ncbi:FRG domain-containing protein [Ectothiorhodospiraceae bacterium WFHF3C12]|nr:FRG domain-containing protein [Ectothiorhodospiraceae bacterium WFHF3C12]
MDRDWPGEGVTAYRGQGNCEWGLSPTFLRRLRQFSIGEEMALLVERKSLEEFQKQAHLHLSHSILAGLGNPIVWWAVMQHHGAPTRLLDWCESIYVAAYFACTSEPECDGAVWVVHKGRVASWMRQTHGDGAKQPNLQKEYERHYRKAGAPHILEFISTTRQTERMIAQQGCFSISRNILADHKEILSQVAGHDERSVFKIIIPASVKVFFLRKLRTMNITANSLFPGLDGLARSVDELMQVTGEHVTNPQVGLVDFEE